MEFCLLGFGNHLALIMSLLVGITKLLFLRHQMFIQRLLLLGVLLILVCTITHQKEFKLGLLIPYTTVASVSGNNFHKGENFAAAMTMAIQDLNSNPSILPGHNISFTWENTKCNELLTIRHEFKLINDKISGIIGPGCYCKTAARNAAAFHLPMLSYVSTVYFVSLLCF